jgi:hypothetical protein
MMGLDKTGSTWCSTYGETSEPTKGDSALVVVRLFLLLQNMFSRKSVIFESVCRTAVVQYQFFCIYIIDYKCLCSIRYKADLALFHTVLQQAPLDGNPLEC